MTELLEPTGPDDPRLAQRASGVLGDANRAGLLAAADVHVAARLGVLAGESDERVLLAVALLVRAAREGSTVLDLQSAADLVPGFAWPPGRDWPDPADWARAVAASPLSRAGVLREEFGLHYLARYHAEEERVGADLQARLGAPPPDVDEAALAAGVARLFPSEAFAEARAACVQAVRQRTTVLTGGPGSGKTTTVAGILALLADQADAAGGRARIALAAPTGKAAARLQEAVAEASARLPAQDRERLGPLAASTLHRLLGVRPGASSSRHHRGNTLPHDVVVVDEASMLPLTMTTRLLDALRPDTRLVLVGDADQLRPVDAGAVLADLVTGLAPRTPCPVVALTGSHRFGAGIAALAEAIRDGDADAVLETLRAGDAAELVGGDLQAVLRPRLLPRAQKIRAAARAGDAERALALLDGHRLLCAHRTGPAGVAVWNRHVERWLAEDGDVLDSGMYLGRPLLVTRNDDGLGLSNGDTGVVVRGVDGPPVAVLVSGADRVRLGASRLSDVDTMHAMTVHKMQGSEADEVTVLLPPPDSALLTRELLYTAVTRARRRVTLVGDEDVLRAALARRALRATGLGPRLLRDGRGDRQGEPAENAPGVPGTLGG